MQSNRIKLIAAYARLGPVLLAIGIASTGCASQSTKVIDTRMGYVPDGDKALKTLPPDAQAWVTAKQKETGGNYDKLSQEDKAQLETIAHGYGRMIFVTQPNSNAQ